MIKRIKKWLDNQRKINEKIENYISSDLNAFQKMGIYFDFLWEAKVHKIQLIDYIQYRFYWKKRVERRNFICFGEFNRIVNESNDPEYFKYFDQKPLFNEKFSAYMGRKWLDVTKCTFEEFSDFVDGVDSYFVKLTDGICGRGAALTVNDGKLDKEKLFLEYKSNNCMLEEVVRQHRELAEFNASSVNTIRVVTFIAADGSVKIMPSIIRLGRAGQIVDNFHHYGIVAIIDTDTGIIKSTGVDREFRRYVIHPDSNKKIVGFQIPNWDKVVSTVKEAAMIIPEIRYVGWDVAIGEDGQIILIEGNKSADHDASQVSDQIGKWYMYQPLLKELEEAGKALKK